ncbi:MAG: alpha/beta hydrolase [Bacteroidales bacterium]|nr:alpha/beta hydrolase [Bacteroidales bacterium]MBP5240950.1 alpha/beta hydrolase [Bacteroidales bacterium]
MAKKIFFREFGKGDDLVILHGILGCSDMWIPVARKLSERYHVVVPDLPNHGLSEHTGSIRFDNVAEIMIDFLKSNHIERPHVVAHSYGAKVAFRMLAGGFPFEKIVAVDMLPATTYADTQITELLHFIAQPLPPLRSFAEAQKLFADRGIEPRFADLLAKGLAMHNGTLQWKFNASVIAESSAGILQHIDFKHIEKTPLLAIKGENSQYIDKESIAQAKAVFHNLSLVEIPGAGHWVQYDQPEAFLNVVYKFLTNNKL